MSSGEELTVLERFSNEIRVATVELLLHRTYGHIGGSLSIVETLAVLYGKVMKVDPHNPKWMDRDWFVLSKGHAGPALYATLALKGFFPLATLNTLNENGTTLPSHPDRLRTPGVDCTAGSLGQGNKVYCIIGDGECNEGQVWEAFQFALGKKLNNLIIFIDRNRLQLDGPVEEVSVALDYQRVMSALGFTTYSVDGSSVADIDQALTAVQSSPLPSCIVLNTTKGQGIRYVEDYPDNHHMRFAEEDVKAIREELDIIKRKWGLN